MDNLVQYMRQPSPSTVFTYLEVVATMDSDGIIASLNIFSAKPDNLKDLACQVNNQSMQKIFRAENEKYLDNFNAIMMDYTVYHDVINNILEFNRIKTEI